MQVIELGQLGQGRGQVAAGSRQQAGNDPASFYVHTQLGGAFGDASAVAAALQGAGNATQQASCCLTGGLSICVITAAEHA